MGGDNDQNQATGMHASQITLVQIINDTRQVAGLMAICHFYYCRFYSLKNLFLYLSNHDSQSL